MNFFPDGNRMTYSNKKKKKKNRTGEITSPHFYERHSSKNKYINMHTNFVQTYISGQHFSMWRRRCLMSHQSFPKTGVHNTKISSSLKSQNSLFQEWQRQAHLAALQKVLDSNKRPNLCYVTELTQPAPCGKIKSITLQLDMLLR